MFERSPAGDMSPAIILEGVSVRYRVHRRRRLSLKQLLVQFGRGAADFVEFWALKDINITVNRGEILGVIGRNGAGKSTLLSVMARVLKPTTGNVVVNGRVAPILGLGAGFDRELTARENIYLSGALLGFSKKDMDERLDRIVEFSELQDFIDAPLNTFSTGMMARLGFAIVTDVDADILLVDEVLAVGDEQFRKKCEERMVQFRENGTTIVLVTHSLEQVRKLCTRAIWLRQGRIASEGDPESVVEQYRQTRPRRRV